MKYAPVKVAREGNNVYITAYIKFCGNYADRVFESGITYAQVAKTSIETAWSGNYVIYGQVMNVAVKVYCCDTGQTPDTAPCRKQGFLKVKIEGDTIASRIMRSHERLSLCGIIRNNETITSWSAAKSSTPIVLYTTQNFQGGNPYKRISQSSFAGISAHEFGHALGLGDAYNAGYRGGTHAGSLDGFYAPKSYEVKDGNGITYTVIVPDDDMMLCNGKVSDNDMRMVLEAYATGKQQLFPWGSKVLDGR